MSSTPTRAPASSPHAELQTRLGQIEYEINRRRIVEHRRAARQRRAHRGRAGVRVDHEWADGVSRWPAQTPDSEEVLSWLYSGIVIAHESQYERLPSVGHVAKQLTEHLATCCCRVAARHHRPARLQRPAADRRPRLHLHHRGHWRPGERPAPEREHPRAVPAALAPAHRVRRQLGCCPPELDEGEATIGREAS